MYRVTVNALNRAANGQVTVTFQEVDEENPDGAVTAGDPNRTYNAFGISIPEDKARGFFPGDMYRLEISPEKKGSKK